MLHVEASTIVHASPVQAADIYCDFNNWPSVFPTIHAVRLIREDAGKIVLAIDHWEGQVVNILTFISPTEIQLVEIKKHYDAQFLNRFEVAPDGARYTVLAYISLKGFAKFLKPFLGGYVRRQIIRFVLEPIKQTAEAAIVSRQLE